MKLQMNHNSTDPISFISYLDYCGGDELWVGWWWWWVLGGLCGDDNEEEMKNDGEMKMMNGDEDDEMCWKLKMKK